MSDLPHVVSPDLLNSFAADARRMGLTSFAVSLDQCAAFIYAARHRIEELEAELAVLRSMTVHVEEDGL